MSTSPGFVIHLDPEARRIAEERLNSPAPMPLSPQQVYDKLDAAQKDARAGIAVAREAAREARAGRIEIAATQGVVLRLESETRALRTAVGEPGDPKALQRASIQDMTAEEIEAAEVGTGLIGAVNRGHMRDEQTLRRIAKSASTSAAIKTAGAGFGAAVSGYAATHPEAVVAFFSNLFGG